MAMIPPAIIVVWLSGLLSVGLIGGGAALVWAWYRDAWVYNAVLDRTVFNPQLGLNWPTAMLAIGISLLVWAFAGGLLLRLVAALKPGRQPTDDSPRHSRDGQVHRLERPDGTVLQIESYGPADAPPLILTHGWGTTSTEWYYLKRQLGQRFRLVVWDLPGVGRSTRPHNRDYSLDAFADHLDAVLRFVDKPALLVGHSIGGMTILTFCKRFPEALGTRVLGLALIHTTYINPVRTARFGQFFTALERPLLVPLLHLTVWLSPLVLLMNWLSYFNGSLQVANHVSGFVGANCWPMADFVSHYNLSLSQGVIARGMLGMLRYDGRPALPLISVPTLIVPGDRDPMCTPEASDYLHQQIAASQLAPLAPAKHMGHMEHNRQFTTLVETFAEAVLQPSGSLHEAAVGRS
jgi:pimeloyl-ACP methyl ester carboxylesterase